jgi:hypothetical protein
MRSETSSQPFCPVSAEQKQPAEPLGVVFVGAFGLLGQLLAVALLFVIPVIPVVYLFLDRENQAQPAGFEQ